MLAYAVELSLLVMQEITRSSSRIRQKFLVILSHMSLYHGPSRIAFSLQPKKERNQLYTISLFKESSPLKSGQRDSGHSRMVSSTVVHNVLNSYVYPDIGIQAQSEMFPVRFLVELLGTGKHRIVLTGKINK